VPAAVIEDLRSEYLQSHSPEKYALEFLAVLQESAYSQVNSGVR